MSEVDNFTDKFFHCDKTLLENLVGNFCNIEFNFQSVINMQYTNGENHFSQFSTHIQCSTSFDDMKMDVDTSLNENFRVEPMNLKQLRIPPTKMNLEKSIEPMDIDESFKAIQNESKVENKPVERRSFSKLIVFICFIVPISFAYLLGRQIDTTETKLIVKNLFNQTFETDIHMNLFGQETVIENLLPITRAEFRTNSSIIYFVGNSGVGKTFTATFLSKHFIFPQNIFKIVGIIHFNQIDLLNQLSKTSFNLIIFDSLKINDLMKIKKFLKRDDFKIYPTIVIIIVTSDLILPKNIVNNSTVIYFNNLTNDVLRRCVIASLENRNLQVTEQKINEVLLYINGEETGCKRIDSKVGVFGGKTNGFR